MTARFPSNKRIYTRLLRQTSSLTKCLVPFARTATMQNRAFSVVGPVVWNGLPQEICLLPGTLTEASLLNSKLYFLAVLESGAPLSSPLEGALYKFMNE